jgi:hypothetical protein
MRISATSTWSAVVAILAVAACNSGNTNPPGPDVVVKDQRPTVDQPAGWEKELAHDGAKGSEVKPTGDSKPSPDTQLAVDKTVLLPDQPDPCAKVTCNVQNDCCECAAVEGKVPVCSIPTCKTSSCVAAGITPPSTRCLNGHCVLESDQTGCTDDKECKKLDDCCTCGAAPVKATGPACNKLCLVNVCSSFGLSKLVARCQKGVCRLAP